MANTYNLLSEFTTNTDPDSISVSPYWVIALVRFAQPLSFSRQKMLSGKSAVSYDADFSAIIRERPLLVLSDSIVSMSITHGKDSYLSSLQAQLVADMNYLSEVQPSDWIMAWIVNDTEAGLDLIRRLNEGKEACNGFMDGLKFVGRVQTIRKNLSQSPDGVRSVRYNLTAGGFHELDSSIFYDPALAEQEDGIGQTLAKLNIGLNEIFEAKQGGVSTTLIIPRLLTLLVGEGVPERDAAPGGVQIATGLTSTPEAPYAYIVPESVGRILGKKSSQNKAGMSYADILELVLGLQKYTTDPELSFLEFISFVPIGSQASNANHRILNDRLLGTFMPLPVSFDNKSIWSILSQFLNPAVNEMYATLRVNPIGHVVPTLVVRQKPFSTPAAMEAHSDKLTGFHELPRWKAHPILINDLDIGKSDALHFNFIHIYGEAAGLGGLGLTQQIVLNPPIRDEHDIKRSGPRSHMQTVACGFNDTLSAPREWMELIADFLIGQQFSMTGTCNVIGIQAPICPGDNFEFEDILYHIESITHVCGISPDGQKNFSTSLTLSHGMRSDDGVSTAAKLEFGATNGNSELLMWPGSLPTDNLGYSPPMTVEPPTRREKEQSAVLVDDFDTGGIA